MSSACDERFLSTTDNERYGHAWKSQRKDNRVAGKFILLYYSNMKSIKEIESAIKNLSPEEFARFQEWYDSFEADHWDRQLEEDINAGIISITQVTVNSPRGRQVISMAHLSRSKVILHHSLYKPYFSGTES